MRYRTYDILNMIDRIRNTSIFSYTLIIEINLTIFIYCNILKKSVTTDSTINVRFRLLVKFDNLSIATTFEVEYTIIIPSVLIITNQLTLRVCRQCCLTSTRKTKEDSCIFTIHVAVCRAVHSSNTLQWQVVVHHREHTLLHFTTIPCVNDDLFLRSYVENNCCLTVKTQFFPVFN